MQNQDTNCHSAGGLPPDVHQDPHSLSPASFFSRRQIQERFGVSLSTVLRWERVGRLAPPITIGRLKRYRLADVMKLEAGGVQ